VRLVAGVGRKLEVDDVRLGDLRQREVRTARTGWPGRSWWSRGSGDARRALRSGRTRRAVGTPARQESDDDDDVERSAAHVILA
jgi:hypothetical protein